MLSGTSSLRLLTLVLLILGIARASLLVLGDPVTGYANQYDMKRSSACLGLWPVTDQDPKEASPEAPFKFYQESAPDGPNCHPSTEVLIAGLGIGLAHVFSSPPRVDIRWVGGTKLALLIMLVLTLHYAMRESPLGAFTHAVIFTTILCDPFNTLFANSLYTEFSAILGAYLAVSTAAAMVLQGRFRVYLGLLWLLGLALLGFSRIQHIVLPIVLIILLFIAMRRLPAMLWVPSVLVSLAALIFQWNLQVGPGVLDDANRINTVFATLLPASQDPVKFAKRLGMQEKCVELTHTSWYLTRGRNHREECPEAFKVSRLKLAAVLATEPSTSMRLVFRALHQSGAWRLPYVGEIAGKAHEKKSGFAGWSIAALVAWLPFPVYMVFYLLPVWLGLCAFILLCSRTRPADTGLRAVHLVLAMLAAVILMAHATSLLGDGFSEYSRHVHLAHNACASAWVLLLIAAATAFSRTPSRKGKPGRTEGMCAAAGTVFLLLAIPVLIPKLALGFGILTTPANERLTGQTIELTGWAMDPSGVSRVEAIALDGTVTLLPLEKAPYVETFFPVGHPPVKFSALLEIGESPAARSFSIVVTSRTGQQTAVDHRFMGASQ
jgi:hypothetical protein